MRNALQQVDAIVSSVNRMGVFADVGPLPVFISNHVSGNALSCWGVIEKLTLCS